MLSLPAVFSVLLQQATIYTWQAQGFLKGQSQPKTCFNAPPGQPISNQAPREGKQRASLKNIPTVKEHRGTNMPKRTAQHSTSSPGTGENFHGSKAATRRWGKGLLKGKSANGDGRNESKAAAGQKELEVSDGEREREASTGKDRAVQLRACTPINPPPRAPHSKNTGGRKRVGREDCQTPGHVSASNISPKAK